MWEHKVQGANNNNHLNNLTVEYQPTRVNVGLVHIWIIFTSVWVIIMKPWMSYFLIFTSRDHPLCLLIILIFQHGRSFGRNREIEPGPVEWEMKEMIIDIYPFYFFSYFIFLVSLVCFILCIFIFFGYVLKLLTKLVDGCFQLSTNCLFWSHNY